jgi:calcineurin-like phosphoesterase family protein
MGKTVAVLIKDKERQYEGLRSSLGLLLESHRVSMFVLNHEIDMTEEYQDNMGFIDEMGGARYSNVPANVEKWGFKPIALEELPAKIRESQVVIPF